MSRLLPIITHPNNILRKKSAPVKAEVLKTAEFKHLIIAMVETMLSKDGAGLAAPQIGQNIRLIAIAEKRRAVVMINPQITKKSWAREIEDEGCLSVINEKGEIVYGPVERHRKVHCSYLDLGGKKKKVEATGLLARVLQHEIDHLDGILFIDRMIPGSKLHVLPEDDNE